MSRARTLSIPTATAIAATVALAGIGCARSVPVVAPSGISQAPSTAVPRVADARAAPTPASAAPTRPVVPDSVETRDQLPCTQQAVDGFGLRLQLSALDAEMEALVDAEDAANVAALAKKIRDLAKSPCFRLLPRVEIAQASLSAAGLRWFWSHGGKEWAMQVLTDDPSHRVTPPPVPESLRLETVPAAQRMFLCTEPSCEHDTDAWQIRAERTINAIGQTPAFTARRPCRRGIRVPGWSELDLELECAAADAGLTWLLPLGGFAAVKDGILTTTASRGDCSEWRAFDVSNGRAAWLTKCGARALRFGLGRVHTDLLRESIFALFVVPHVNDGPTATTITIPPAIRPLSTLGEFPEGVDGRAGASSRQVQHSLAYFHDGVLVLSGKVKWPQDLTYPERVYLVWLLDLVDASWRGDCSASREYRPLANALARAFPALTDALAPLREAKHPACETPALSRFGAENP